MITCAAHIALNRTEQLKGRFERALNNGVTPEEIGEMVTHLAFHGGWPVAMSGALVARDVLESYGK
jgi:4-carboxymuconolactone decarboxylase